MGFADMVIRTRQRVIESRSGGGVMVGPSGVVQHQPRASKAAIFLFFNGLYTFFIGIQYIRTYAITYVFFILNDACVVPKYFRLVDAIYAGMIQYMIIFVIQITGYNTIINILSKRKNVRNNLKKLYYELKRIIETLHTC